MSFFVRALYDFASDEASGLSFSRGDVIEVLARLESGWWNGICEENRGWFPSNYVELLTPEQVQLYLQQRIQIQQQFHQHLQQPVSPTEPSTNSVQQQQQSQPGSAGVDNITTMASMDHSLLTAAANESIYRRGSIAVADGQSNVASAVPPRLRMNRRSSIPYNPAADTDADSAPIAAPAPARDMADSTSTVSSHPMANQISDGSNGGNAIDAGAYDADAPRVAQWESRMTLDGRTYFCNIFTDKTVWDISTDIAEQGDQPNRSLELIGDEVTLVYVSLMMGQQKDGSDSAAAAAAAAQAGTHYRGRSHQRSASHRSGYSLADTQQLPISSHGTSAWEQLSASISVAAFNLASSVSARAKHEYLPLVSQVVAAVKRLFLSSSGGGFEQDGPVYRTHRLLRDSHKAIIQYVCALTLSAKVASTVWPPPDAADAVHADVAGLVRSVRKFVIDAENSSIPVRHPALPDESIEFLPGIELDPSRLRTMSFSLGHAAAAASDSARGGSKRLSTLQRNEHTGATVLVKNSSGDRSGAADAAAGGASLFAKDHTGIRQRLRQHLAEHHQRTNSKFASSLVAGDGDPRMANDAGFPSTADVLLQLDEGARELARVILMFDRYLRKIERFYVEEIRGDKPAADMLSGSASPVASPRGTQPPGQRSSVNHMRSAADARLVAYAKHLVAALAVFLQVLDDFDMYGNAIVAAATNDDPNSSESGPASLVLSTLNSVRSCRGIVNDSVGFLVAATQDFADYAHRFNNSINPSAPEDGMDDPEIVDDASANANPSSGDQPVPSAERVLGALAQIGESLQALNHNTMSLDIAAKRVVEACDICDLRVLWLRVAKYHVPPSTLASVPIGPAGSGRRSSVHASISNAAAQRSLGYRRSISLPVLRRAPPGTGGGPLADGDSLKDARASRSLSRPRADTVDTPDNLAIHLSRRLEKGGAKASDTDEEGSPPMPTPAFREARAKDKLNRFFGDDPAQYSQSKRPSQLEELSITPVSSTQLNSGSVRTPTKATSTFGDEAAAGGSTSAPNGAQSTISSRASTAPSARAPSNSTIMSPGPQDQIPWYLSYDSSPEDLLLTSDGQVKGSTLPALVERLVAHDVSDPNFVSTFLLTYHSFTTTPELFEGLFKRFLIQPPSGLLDHELTEWTERKLKPVRLRVYNLFKTWLEQHYVEQVEGDPLGLEMLREFACTTMAEHMSNAAEQLVRLIDKRRASQGGLRRLVPNMPHAAPPPILPRSLSRLRPMDINPLELARQFTLIDSTMFNKVRPIECLKTAWSKKPGDPKAFNGLTVEIASNVKAMSTLSTQTTLWVTANILHEHEIKKRAAVIKYFITFAENCRNLNNFNTLMSVLGALNSVPVERLTRTWQAVQQKSLATYNQLKQIMRTDRNFSEYRDALHSCNPPAIPFVGTYLQDLTFIEDGNDDMIPNASHLINFAKRQRTASTIRDLQQFQNVPYNLTPVAEIQDWLLKRLEELCPNGQSSDRLVEEFWKMSTTLEPKEKDSERVLRLLQESGFL